MQNTLCDFRKKQTDYFKWRTSKLTANYILKMDVDFILLFCTLLPGLRQLSLKQQRRCLVSIWCLTLLFIVFEVQIKSLSILAVFLASLYNSIQSRNLGNIVYIRYCDIGRHGRQKLHLFSVKLVVMYWIFKQNSSIQNVLLKNSIQQERSRYVFLVAWRWKLVTSARAQPWILSPVVAHLPSIAVITVWKARTDPRVS